MIKLEIDIDDLNYDDLMEQYLPVMAEKLRASGNPVAMLISNGMPAAMASVRRSEEGGGVVMAEKSKKVKRRWGAVRPCQDRRSRYFAPANMAWLNNSLGQLLYKT